jgi:hypothetical protein
MDAPVFLFQMVDAVVGCAMLSKEASGAALECMISEGALRYAGIVGKNRSAALDCGVP